MTPESVRHAGRPNQVGNLGRRRRSHYTRLAGVRRLSERDRRPRGCTTPHPRHSRDRTTPLPPVIPAKGDLYTTDLPAEQPSFPRRRESIPEQTAPHCPITHTTRSPRVAPLLQRRVSRDARNLPTVIPAKAGIHPRADRAVLPHHPHDPLTPSTAACFSGAYRGAHATSPPSFPRRRESIPGKPRRIAPSPTRPAHPQYRRCFSGAYRGAHATSPPSFPRRRESIPEQTAPHCPITHMTRSPPVAPLASAARIEGRTQPPHRHSREGGNPSPSRPRRIAPSPTRPAHPQCAACFSGAYRGAHATSPPSFPRRRESIPEQTAPYCPITHTTRSPPVPPLASAARIEGPRTQPPHRHSREGGNPSPANRAALPHHPHDPLTPSTAAASAARIEGRAQGNRASPDPRPKQGGHDPRRRSELWTKPHGCATVSSGEGAGGWPRPALGRTSWIGGVPFSAQNVTPARYQRHRTAQNDTV